jgi:hypothetical protein
MKGRNDLSMTERLAAKFHAESFGWLWWHHAQEHLGACIEFQSLCPSSPGSLAVVEC